MSKALSDDAAFTPSAPPPVAARRPKARAVALGFSAAVAIAVLGYFGVRHLVFALAHEDTDDAQVEGDVSPVLPRTSGYVARVLVRDNEHVEAGQPLIEVDHDELDLRVAGAAAALRSAEAALQDASAALASARAAEKVAEANAATGAVVQAKAAADLARDSRLFQTQAITDRQLEDSRAAEAVASAQLEALRRQAGAAAAGVAVAASREDSARTLIGERKSALDYARLERSYATVRAPIAGAVSRKSVEPGQFVQAGQTVLSIASDSDVWVVANFKETQLARMRAGQEAEVSVDAYPGVPFRGRVESIAGATGARFALLPPDNSSGNFVKVTQRVPVKIVLAGPADPAHPLRPGMSVDAAVLIRE